jgi:3-oxoacyl-[acyl-carrier protein] reductase
MARPLDGRVAIVTGAGRGLGRAIAIGLAEAGARVAVVSRTRTELDAVAGEIQRGGGTALAIAADVGHAGDPERVAAQVRADFDAIDILINNAAVAWPVAPTADVDIEAWQAAVEINLIGPVRLTRAALPGMLGRGWGRIVNVSSGVATNPAGMLRGSAYTTSKAGLEGHTLNLAAELEGSGVTANIYRPGPVDSSMQTWIREQDPGVIGEELHQRFIDNLQNGVLIAAESSARVLLEHLTQSGNGETWDVRG